MQMSQGSPSPEQFKARLDEHYQWPTNYMFKFVAPKGKLPELLEALPKGIQQSQKESRTGKYTSVTVVDHCSSSDQVIEVYQRISQIEGVMAL